MGFISGTVQTQQRSVFNSIVISRTTETEGIMINTMTSILINIMVIIPVTAITETMVKTGIIREISMTKGSRMIMDLKVVTNTIKGLTKKKEILSKAKARTIKGQSMKSAMMVETAVENLIRAEAPEKVGIKRNNSGLVTR